jgi:hypothetical protein
MFSPLPWLLRLPDLFPLDDYSSTPSVDAVKNSYLGHNHLIKAPGSATTQLHTVRTRRAPSNAAHGVGGMQ